MNAVNVASLFPYIFEVEISDPKIIIDALKGRDASSIVRLREMQPVRLSFKIEDQHDESIEYPAEYIWHEMAAVSAEVLAAQQIFQRIGTLLFESAEPYVSPGTFSLERSKAFRRGLIRSEIILKQRRFNEVLDLGNEEIFAASKFSYFDVQSVSLESPLKVKARLAALMMAATPMATPVTAPPLIAAISHPAMQSALAGAALGYTVHVHLVESDNQERQEVDELLSDAARGEIVKIQIHLKFLNYYHYPLDNIRGRYTNEAIIQFAIDYNLASNYRDPHDLITNQEYLTALVREAKRARRR